MDGNKKLFYLESCDSIKRVMEIREGGLVRKNIGKSKQKRRILLLFVHEQAAKIDRQYSSPGIYNFVESTSCNQSTDSFGER